MHAGLGERKELKVNFEVLTQKCYQVLFPFIEMREARREAVFMRIGRGINLLKINQMPDAEMEVSDKRQVYCLGQGSHGDIDMGVFRI